MSSGVDRFVTDITNLLRESPQFERVKMDDATLREKVKSFVSDTKNAHYVDNFIRILLNPDTLHVSKTPIHSNSATHSRTMYNVSVKKVGGSSSFGFIKGVISSYTSINYTMFTASQISLDPTNADMVKSLRIIIEPKEGYSLSFSMEFELSENTSAKELYFKVCDRDHYYVHDNPLIFRVEKTHSFPLDKCSSPSKDSNTTSRYTFKKDRDLDALCFSSVKWQDYY